MKNILITGAAGELGQSIVAKLVEMEVESITCLDLQPQPEILSSSKITWIKSNITDYSFIAKLINKSEFDTIFHFAALLSSAAAKNPELAQHINVEASKNIIESARNKSEQSHQNCRFIFPSSIAVFGLNAQFRLSELDESAATDPITFYGKQKLEIEHFGVKICADCGYFDFRSVRFPGLISAETLPVGGTSDYASLMAHSAAKGQAYSCFVSADTTLSFLAMPDAVQALIKLSAAERTKLNKFIYNLHGFTISAQEIADFIKKAFPHSDISFNSISEKQKIIDSWPATLDCSAFSKDLGWTPLYNKEQTFFNYLFPSIIHQYS